MPKAKRKVLSQTLANEVEFSEQPNESVVIVENKTQSIISKSEFDSKFEIITEQISSEQPV